MKKGILYILLTWCFAACNKLVEVQSPPTSLSSENIYTSDQTAVSVLTNIYGLMSGGSPIAANTINGISLVGGLSADELTLAAGPANINASLVLFYLNNLNPGLSLSSGFTIWGDLYSKIYVVNIALENLRNSTGLTPAVKQQLTGEAKFLRAFFYFWLTNLYGEVPLITASDYTINEKLANSNQSKIYQQITSDLKDAQNLLSTNYMAGDAMTATSEKVRPNKWTSTALLAKAYLYNKQYDSAEAAATRVINSGVYQLDTLKGVFLKNSSEAIWQLQPVNAGWNTEDARIFILPPSGPNSTSTVTGTAFPVYISPQLLAAFEPGDTRRLIWIDSVIVNGSTYYYPYKYKSAQLNNPVTEYTMVFRLGEQYLIRAEARAEQNLNIAGAMSDLNAIRTRANLPPNNDNNQTDLLNDIQHERQVELFTEWGHRWLDLKRTGNVDNTMESVTPAKGGTWSTNWQLYPIPLYDITLDQNLKQNSGY